MIEIQDVIQNDIGRFYVIEGVTYPSMTTVLGHDSAEYIDKWRERVGIEVADKKTEHALRRGNAIHKMAEDYLLTGEYDQSDVYFNMLFKPIKKWLDNNVVKILSVEDVLFSKKLKIAGRCDLIALTHDGWKIIDFKTAEKYKEPEWISNYYMQASGYAYCHNEMYQSKINRFTILIVNESSMNVNAYDGYAHEHIRDLAEKRLKFKQLHNI
jgi:ATP-dependent exoDNAse (exonuclease V) beta subunit